MSLGDLNVALHRVRRKYTSKHMRLVAKEVVGADPLFSKVMALVAEACEEDKRVLKGKTIKACLR